MIEQTSIGWDKWVRQTHRWLSIVFTMTVIANFVSMAFGKPPAWIVYLPLPPLFLMLFTGLYMFVLPYAANAARAKPADRNKHSGQQGEQESQIASVLLR